MAAPSSSVMARAAMTCDGTGKAARRAFVTKTVPTCALQKPRQLAPLLVQTSYVREVRMPSQVVLPSIPRQFATAEL